MRINRTVLFILASLFIIQFPAAVRGENTPEGKKWKKISGKWESSGGILSENRAYAKKHGYSSLIDRNSLISIEEVSGFGEISFELFMSPYKDREPQVMFFFEASDFSTYRGLLIEGKKSISGISFVECRHIDPAQKSRIKNNYSLKKTSDASINLPFSGYHRISLSFTQDAVEVFINEKSSLKENLSPAGGYIGFSSMDSSVKIKNFQVRGVKGIIFTDAFTDDTISSKKAVFKKK